MDETLRALEAESRRAREPRLVRSAYVAPGGVDPLGLRQINFDLMNEIFPGLNNVARYVRPFTLVAWAWRRTIALAGERQLRLPLSMHEDFVARIEVAFVWSMLQGADPRDVDLPGKQLIARRWGNAGRLKFGDDAWLTFVKNRRHSTALTAAVNYGPGLRALRLLEDDLDQPGVRVPGEGTAPMLDAFEAKLKPVLSHKLFRGWDPCVLTRKDAIAWRERWKPDGLLSMERAGLRERLIGQRASTARRDGFELLRTALTDLEDPDENEARAAMWGPFDDESVPAASKWRRLQVRQTFRLALEALLEWIAVTLGGDTLTTTALASLLLEEIGGKAKRTGPWLRALASADRTALEARTELEEAFGTQDLARAIFAALGTAVLSPIEFDDGSNRRERLPITTAADDFRRLEQEPKLRFVAHVIEQWVIAQHTFWSVGRGLADARAGAKSILRLRLVLEPDGWRVTRGGGSRGMPGATPDRLLTAMYLARQVEILAD